jgi:hypothetical protein
MIDLPHTMLCRGILQRFTTRIALEKFEWNNVSTMFTPTVMIFLIEITLTTNECFISRNNSLNYCLKYNKTVSRLKACSRRFTLLAQAAVQNCRP